MNVCSKICPNKIGIWAALLLTLIFIILIGWNYIKLIIEVAERYAICGIIAYTVPLAVATGSSKATLRIFENWRRFIASQILLMVMNVWSLALIILVWKT